VVGSRVEVAQVTASYKRERAVSPFRFPRAIFSLTESGHRRTGERNRNSS
jgi:hypothetical protein